MSTFVSSAPTSPTIQVNHHNNLRHNHLVAQPNNLLPNLADVLLPNLPDNQVNNQPHSHQGNHLDNQRVVPPFSTSIQRPKSLRVNHPEVRVDNLLNNRRGDLAGNLRRNHLVAQQYNLLPNLVDVLLTNLPDNQVNNQPHNHQINHLDNQWHVPHNNLRHNHLVAQPNNLLPNLADNQVNNQPHSHQGNHLNNQRIVPPFSTSIQRPKSLRVNRRYIHHNNQLHNHQR